MMLEAKPTQVCVFAGMSANTHIVFSWCKVPVLPETAGPFSTKISTICKNGETDIKFWHKNPAQADGVSEIIFIETNTVILNNLV